MTKHSCCTASCRRQGGTDCGCSSIPFLQHNGHDPYNTNESEDIEGVAPPLDEVSLGGLRSMETIRRPLSIDVIVILVAFLGESHWNSTGKPLLLVDPNCVLTAQLPGSGILWMSSRRGRGG